MFDVGVDVEIDVEIDVGVNACGVNERVAIGRSDKK
jgi:hypothetical protein